MVPFKRVGAAILTICTVFPPTHPFLPSAIQHQIYD